MFIKTANGETELELVHCEVTGEWLGWATVLPEEAIIKGCTPAYISFNVVDEEGNQLIDISDIDTF